MSTTAPSESRPFTMHDFNASWTANKALRDVLLQQHHPLMDAIRVALLQKHRFECEVDSLQIEEIQTDVYFQHDHIPDIAFLLNQPALGDWAMIRLYSTFCIHLVEHIGGSRKLSASITPRPLTSLELKFTHRLILLILNELQAVFQDKFQIDASSIQHQTDVNGIQSLSKNRLGLNVRLGIRYSGVQTQIELIYSTDAMEGLFPTAESEAASNEVIPTPPAHCEMRLLESMKHAELDIVAVFGRTTLPLENILALRVGDILPIQQPIGLPMVISVNGEPLFTAFPGTIRSNYGFRIYDTLDDPSSSTLQSM